MREAHEIISPELPSLPQGFLHGNGFLRERRRNLGGRLGRLGEIVPGFVKLFSDIVDSSIWDEDSDTCKVWVTLLALANPDGFVRGSEGWLASKSRVSIGKCALALRKFQEDDIRSRTPDNDGKRIKVVNGGWLILNYLKFRNDTKVLSTDRRRTYQREWMRAKRASASASASCQQVSTIVNSASASEKSNRGVGEERVNGGQMSEAGKKAFQEFCNLKHKL